MYIVIGIGETDGTRIWTNGQSRWVGQLVLDSCQLVCLVSWEGALLMAAWNECYRLNACVVVIRGISRGFVWFLI